MRRIRDAGLSWPLPGDLDDDALEAKLFAPPGPPGARPVPDWAKVHLELRRKGVTLMLLWHEYRETFPDGYAYSQFNELYRHWKLHLDVVMRQEHKAGEKMFVDFPGQTVPIYDHAPDRWPCQQSYLSPPWAPAGLFIANCSRPRNCCTG